MPHTTPAASPAGRRRYWVTVLCFLLANCAAWVAHDRWQHHRRPLLEVVRFEPGGGATVAARPTFAWSFNLDVAPPAADAPPPGRFTPAVAGRWQWKTPRTLT